MTSKGILKSCSTYKMTLRLKSMRGDHSYFMDKLTDTSIVTDENSDIFYQRELKCSRRPRSENLNLEDNSESQNSSDDYNFEQNQDVQENIEGSGQAENAFDSITNLLATDAPEVKVEEPQEETFIPIQKSMDRSFIDQAETVIDNGEPKQAGMTGIVMIAVGAVLVLVVASAFIAYIIKRNKRRELFKYPESNFSPLTMNANNPKVELFQLPGIEEEEENSNANQKA